MLGEHGIGKKLYCDYGNFQVPDRSWLRKHLGKDYQTPDKILPHFFWCIGPLYYKN